MTIKDIMSQDIIFGSSSDSIQQAARLMAQYDIGFLPIRNSKRVIGCVTDRDLAIYGLANDTYKVSDIMKPVLITVSENSTILDAIKIMKTFKIRRLIVKNNKKIVGIISISDIINKSKEKDIVDMLKSILKIDKNTQISHLSVKDFEL